VKTIQVYLIRHGLAADRNQEIPDEQRPLTPKGESRTRQVAQRLSALKLHFDLILTSPLLRARQTAEIFQFEGLGVRMDNSAALAPGGSFEQWLAWLQDWQGSHPTALALIGHQPDLSQWAELLIWGEVKQVLELKKAGVIGLTLPTTASPVGNSCLFWLTPPRLLL